MTDKRLDAGIDPEKQKLKNAIGEDPANAELLGYAVMYTVGSDWNCLVPREWLLDRVDELGIPQWVAPNKVQHHHAFSRAVKRMREDWLDREWQITAPRLDNGIEEPHTVTVDLKEGDGTYLWHVRAEVFFDEEECKQEGGKWVQHNLGYVDYDTENQYVVARKDDDLGEDDLLFQVWEDVVQKVRQFQSTMQEVHIAQDIRQMMYYATRDYTENVIQLRRSVYLFPAGMTDFVEKMAQLYADIDRRFKAKGEPVAVRTIEVLDLDDKREWVEQKVEASLRESITAILEEAFDEFDEGEAADEVVKTIKGNLDSSVETAETYNALLQAQLDVEEVLEEQQQEVAKSDHGDIIDRVIDQTDLGDF